MHIELEVTLNMHIELEVTLNMHTCMFPFFSVFICGENGDHA